MKKQLTKFLAIIALVVISPLAQAASRSCSNFEIDAAKLASQGGAVSDYLNGTGGKYILDVLNTNNGALTFDVQIPNQPTLFKTQAGKTLKFAALLCFPTRDDNPASDYSSNGIFVSRMLTSGNTPIPDQSGRRYPLVVHSHGGLPDLVADSGNGTDYASLTLFHGDCRNVANGLCSGNISSIPETFAIRVVMLKAAIDTLLARPELAALIDVNRIGARSESNGGGTIIPALAGGISSSIGSDDLVSLPQETRIKTAKLLTPPAGLSGTMLDSGKGATLLGANQRGAANIQTAVFATMGTADTLVSLSDLQKTLAGSKGAGYLAVQAGADHGTINNCTTCTTWGSTFENAMLKGDLDAYEQFKGYASLSGVTLTRYNDNLAQTRAEQAAADRVFSWAEAVYPSLFAAHATSATIQGYYARCYGGNARCVGAKDGSVIYYDGKNVAPVGTLKDLLSQVVKAGY